MFLPPHFNIHVIYLRSNTVVLEINSTNRLRNASKKYSFWCETPNFVAIASYNHGQNIWNNLDICYFFSKKSPFPLLQCCDMHFIPSRAVPRACFGKFHAKNNIVDGGRGFYFYFQRVPIYFVHDCRKTWNNLARNYRQCMQLKSVPYHKSSLQI